jgi:hypothetical protein
MCGGSSAYSGSWRHSGYAAPRYCDGGWAVIILDTWVQQVEPGALARRTGQTGRIPGQHELAAVCGVWQCSVGAAVMMRLFGVAVLVASPHCHAGKGAQ